MFEETKEEFVIIHGREGDGADFRMLGTWVDTSLRMESNVGAMISKARPKIQALLRSQRFYDVEDGKAVQNTRLVFIRNESRRVLSRPRFGTRAFR